MATDETMATIADEPAPNTGPEAAAEEPKAEQKKAKASKEPKPRKPRSAPTHPPYLEVRSISSSLLLLLVFFFFSFSIC